MNKRGTINLTCSENTCQHTLSLPIVTGGMLPALDPYCRKCDSIYIITSFEAEVKSVSKTESTQTNSKFRIPKVQISNVEITRFENFTVAIGEGGHNIFTGFVNRITPLFVLTQMIGDIQSNGSADLESVIVNWHKTSDSIRNHLRTHEDSLGAGRGERLSDGFPSADPLADGPMKISLRNALGTNGRYLLENRGWLQKLGLVERIDSTTLCLTELSQKVMDMPDLRKVLLEATPQVQGDQPPLVVFIPEKVAEQILDLLAELMPDEFAFVIDILQQINQEDGVLGWNSNNYAPMIVDQSLKGQFHSRWMHHDGTTPLLEMYLNKGYKFKADKKRKGKSKIRDPEEFATNRLLKHVNSTLGGQLSRLKELGLIYPVRVGREKNFHLTDFGSRILAVHSQEQEAEE